MHHVALHSSIPDRFAIHCSSALYDDYVHCADKAAIAIRLRFGFDSTTTKNEHVHFFVASRGVVANKKAAVGAYNEATL